jgi:hypothetical protein
VQVTAVLSAINKCSPAVESIGLPDGDFVAVVDDDDEDGDDDEDDDDAAAATTTNNNAEVTKTTEKKKKKKDTAKMRNKKQDLPASGSGSGSGSSSSSASSSASAAAAGTAAEVVVPFAEDDLRILETFCMHVSLALRKCTLQMALAKMVADHALEVGAQQLLKKVPS